MSSTSGSSWERIPSDYDIISSSPNSDDIDDKAFEHSGYENPDFKLFDEQLELPHAPLLDGWRNIKPFENAAELVQKYFDRYGSSRAHNLIILLAVWAAMADTIEIVAVSYIIPHVKCQFKFSSFELSVLTSIIFLGLLVGSITWGSFGDQIGRRKTLILSLSMNAFFGLLSSLSSNYIQLLLFRFLSGTGVGGSIPVIFTYVSEIAPSHRKGLYLSVLATSWVFGNVTTAILAYIVLPVQTIFTSWRIFLVLCSVPALTSTLLFIICPESPLWLASKGQITSSINSVKRFYPHQSIKELEHYRHHFSSNESNNHRYNRNTNIIDFMKKMFSHKYYKRSVMLSIVNFALSFSTYGLSLWLPTVFAHIESAPDASFCESVKSVDVEMGCNINLDSKQYIDSILYALVQLPANIITIIIMDNVGPKSILMISLLSNTFISICLLYSSCSWESFIICCVYSLISVFSWNSLNILNSFLFPADIRSTATGILSGVNRIGGLLGSLSFGLLLQTSCVLSMFIMAGSILFGFVAASKLHVPRHF